MKRLKLTTEDVFEKSGQRMRVLTSGIDLSERFNDNPLMLFEHNPEKILGLWSAVQVSEDNISAVPNFDEDELSNTIAGKFQKGTVKSASIGIEVKDAYMDGDVMIISKSILYEASLVGIPANKNAKTVDFSKTVLLSLSDGKELTEDYINKIKDMTEKEIVESPDLKVDEKVIIDETKVMASKDSDIEDLKADKVELSLKLTNSEKDIVNIKKEYDELKLSITEKDSLVDSLKKEILELKGDRLDVLLSNAVADGKISNEAKAEFLDLSFEKAESILSKISPSELSLSAELSKRQNTEPSKTYAWYLKNDKAGLIKLSKENPSLLKQLETEYINLNK